MVRRVRLVSRDSLMPSRTRPSFIYARLTTHEYLLTRTPDNRQKYESTHNELKLRCPSSSSFNGVEFVERLFVVFSLDRVVLLLTIRSSFAAPIITCENQSQLIPSSIKRNMPGQGKPLTSRSSCVADGLRRTLGLSSTRIKTQKHQSPSKVMIQRICEYFTLHPLDIS